MPHCDQAAAPALQEVVRDPNHLARDRALPILSKVLALEAARSVYAAHPEARSIQLDDLPEPLRTPDNASLLSKQYVSGITRLLVEKGISLGETKWVQRHQLNTCFSPWKGTNEQGILVLSGMEQDGKSIFSRVFHFDKVAYKALKIMLKGQAMAELVSTAPVVRVRVIEDGVIELARPETVNVEVEEIEGPAQTTPGSRVAIRGHKGTVKSTDDAGLVQVQLDKAYRGETELLVIPKVLRGVVKKTIARPGYRLLAGRLAGETLTIRDDLSRVTETLD